jgi:outer membrane protein assembly factor BamB/tRNA A-37 threonylcarbamoyl transferase component Bud32
MGSDIEPHDQNTRPLPDEEGGFGERLAPGTVLANRYSIEDVIGEGGMGAVYRARDLHFPTVTKLVAVKEMISQARDPLVREMIEKNFEREATLLATLSHPSIPRIYDYFSQNQRSYLVLEYIHGKDLDAILNSSEDFLPVNQVVDWAIQLCEVLEFLHSHKPEAIIFRDMKPSNVMINQFGHVILVDFGIAKVFKAGQRGTMMGTEGYSPPEQYRGEASPVGDIYALGATLHHLLTRVDPQREPPFTFAERPIRQYNPNVSPELEAVINKALEYLPENRYQSASEMGEALMKVAHQTGLITPSRSRSLQRVAEQNQFIKPLWTFEAEDEIRGTPIYYEGGVYIGTLDNNLYALDAFNGQLLWKFPTEGGIVGRPAAQDSFLYFGSEDQNFYVVTAHDGKLVWSYRTEGRVRSSPVLTEEYVFFGSDDGYLHALNLATGRRLWRFAADGPVRSTPFVQDKLIYFGDEDGNFYCVDYMAGIRWHYKAKRAVTSSPVVVEGNVYFASMDSSMYAFDAKMGWELWRYRMKKGSISTPCVYDHLIYIGSVDGSIYCLDRFSGREVWSFQTGHQVTASPIVKDGKLVCGSVDGNLYCLDAANGRLIWKFATGGPITGAPVICADLLFFGSTDHFLYAIQF